MITPAACETLRSRASSSEHAGAIDSSERLMLTVTLRRKIAVPVIEARANDFRARALRMVGDLNYRGAVIMLPRDVGFAAFFLGVSLIAASVGSSAQERKGARGGCRGGPACRTAARPGPG